MRKTFLIIISVVILVMLFVFIFPGKIVLPQSFNIGPFNIHYYGIVMAAAVLAGYLLAKNRAPQYGIDPKAADDIIFWTIIGGFLAARIYHIASSFGYYSQHPFDMLKVWNGGLSIYGAILGGVITLWLCQKILHHKSSILNLLDWLAPSVLLGQIIGRFGNLFNYEAFGYPTDLPWKMFVPQDFRPESLANFQYFHPLFLYEALGNIVILFALLRFFKNRQTGALFFSYLLLYNILRFFLEFLRTDSTFVGNWRLNSLTSLSLVLISLAALIIIRKKCPNTTSSSP